MGTKSKGTKKRRRWPYVILIIVALPVVAVLLGPTWLSSDSGRRFALKQVAARVPGITVDLQAWRLRWRGPCSIEELSVTHADGELKVQRIGLSRGLMALIPVGAMDLGTIRIDDPVLTLQAESDAALLPSPPPDESTTVEAEIPTPEPAVPSAPQLPISDLIATLDIHGGRVLRRSSQGETVTLVDSGVLSLDLEGLTQPLSADLALEIAGHDSIPGRVSLKAKIHSPLQWVQPNTPGGRAEARLTVEDLDLARISAFLPPSPDRPGIAGRCDAVLDARLSSLQDAVVEANIGLRELQVTPVGADAPAMPPTTAGLALSAGLTNGVISVEGGRIRSPWLQGELQGRVSQTTSPTDRPYPLGQVNARARIDLARLVTDFGPLLGVDPALRIEQGLLHASVDTTAGEDAVRAEVKAWTEQLDLRYGATAIDVTPTPQLDAVGQWSPGTPPRIENLTLQLPGGTLKAHGNADSAKVEGRFDLGRLTTFADQLVDTLPIKAGGTLTLDANMQKADETTRRLVIDATARSLRLELNGSVYDDPELHLGTEMLLKGDHLEIPFLQLKSAVLDITGSLADRDTADGPAQELNGRWAIHYDLLNTWRAQAGWPWPIVAGSAPRPIRASWPLPLDPELLLQQLQLSATTHVARIEAYELKLGAADLGINLSEGHAHLGYAAPFDGGRLDLAPQIDLTVAPPVLALPKGRAIDNLPLTQSMVDELLVHINPLLRGCAVVGGRISLDVNSCSLPLDADALRSEMAFDVILSLTNAVFTPAGVLNDALGMVGLAGRELRLESYALPIRCHDGRITPEPMRATVSGYPLTFSGSVGLDQTIQMVMKTPLSRELLGKTAAQYTEGMAIGIAVGGTVTRPRIDSDATRAQLRQLTQDAARKAATQELGDALNRWLRKREK